MRAIAVVVLCGVLAGCAGPNSFFNTNTQADAGQAPTDVEAKVKAHLRYSLKDPDSVKDLAVGLPVLSQCAVGVYGSYHGWRVGVEYNAKNSYGGYVGLRTYYYWFHGENLKGIGQSAYDCPEAPGWR